MMADVVLQAPQEHERWHKQQHAPARPQHAPHLTKPREIVVHMFDDIERRHEIERAILVRKRFGCAKLYFVEPTLATERKRVFRNIDALRVTILREHQKIRARTATHVENSGATIGYTPANFFHKAGENTS